MNKRGGMVLRDVVFIIIIFSVIIALSSVFVSEMGNTYSNANMTSSYDKSSIGSEQLNETSTRWEEIGENLNGNIIQMLVGTLQAAGEILKEVLLAPAKFSSMLTSILTDFGVDDSIVNIIRLALAGALYILIVFVIISAFLQGGKL